MKRTLLLWSISLSLTGYAEQPAIFKPTTGRKVIGTYDLHIDALANDGWNNPPTFRGAIRDKSTISIRHCPLNNMESLRERSSGLGSCPDISRSLATRDLAPSFVQKLKLTPYVSSTSVQGAIARHPPYSGREQLPIGSIACSV
jgi:hypothetical protein